MNCFLTYVNLLTNLPGIYNRIKFRVDPNKDRADLMFSFYIVQMRSNKMNSNRLIWDIGSCAVITNHVERCKNLLFSTMFSSWTQQTDVNVIFSRHLEHVL